jgi:dTDP-4-amino-4,6-dideoxygalactose transaminase
LKIGKLIHFFATKLGLLSRATSPDEKQGKKPDMIPARLPNSLARIAWEQLEDVDKINMHRKEISQIYIDAFDGDKHVKLIFENSKYPLLRFPLKVDDKNSLLSYLKNNNIYLGNWYEVPIAPKEVDPGVVGYELGACPNAEDTGADIVNLPTHVNIHVKEADKIIYHIKEFYELRY